jgi:two-component system, NtrC family, response regulator AtoC
MRGTRGIALAEHSAFESTTRHARTEVQMTSPRPTPERRHEHILVVESAVTTRDALSGFLAGRGYRARSVCPDEALPHFENDRPGAVILNLSGRTALDVLATFREIDRRVPIVVIADRQHFGMLEQSSPSATLIGRPFDGRELEAALNAAMRRRAATPPYGADRGDALDDLLLGDSAKMQAVRALVARVADSDVTVLVRGETGTGKELVARGLRSGSTRRDKPFVKVNCAALPGELLESELFGFERGAFTGAQQAKPGRFEAADGGTIFLDEIGEMPATLQAKLLQVLQDGEFSRLGGLTEVHVDVRIVAATNCDLEHAVATGAFREDLYFRINVVEITLPPLRERKEDLPLLVDHFLERQREASRHTGRQPGMRELSDETLDLFASYDWPGNVRELENLVKRIVVLGDEAVAQDVIERRQHAVPVRPIADPGPVALPPAEPGNRLTSLKDIGKSAAREAERIAILDMLERTRWNRKEAAEILGISYKALLYKIKDNRLDEAS